MSGLGCVSRVVAPLQRETTLIHMIDNLGGFDRREKNLTGARRRDAAWPS